jgi:hypothetical protein
VRNPAQVNTRSKSLTIKVMCWPQTWRRAKRKPKRLGIGWRGIAHKVDAMTFWAWVSQNKPTATIIYSTLAIGSGQG